MVQGTLVDVFNDMWTGTGPLNLTAPTHPVSLEVRHLWLYWRAWKNHGRPVDGGKQFIWTINPRGTRTFQGVLPMTPTIPTNEQTSVQCSENWRFARVYSTTADFEILGNEALMNGNGAFVFQKFLDMKTQKDNNAQADMSVGLENQTSAVPNAAAMQGIAGATEPASYIAINNECTSGLWGSGFTASAAVTAAGGAWTTKFGHAPSESAMNGKYVPQWSRYSTTGSSQSTNIIGALDALRSDLKWESPGSLSQYQSDNKLNNLLYLTTKAGERALKSLMRGDQDRYVMGGQDPAYNGIMFQGVPIERWDPLETGTYYDGASALQTEGNAAGTQFKGPRVYANNMNFLYPIAHSQRIFYEDKPIRSPNMPDTWVKYLSHWYANICTSFLHQGGVAPSVDCYISAGTGGNLYA